MCSIGFIDSRSKGESERTFRAKFRQSGSRRCLGDKKKLVQSEAEFNERAARL
jgi:hypothetical protein